MGCFEHGSRFYAGASPVYASRAHSTTEVGYAQTENECLAIVFSLEGFHQYTFGRKNIVNTDHKSLETIFKKPLCKAPKRIHGMLLRLLQYDIVVKYTKGKYMLIADTLSKAYLADGADSCEQFSHIDAVELAGDCESCQTLATAPQKETLTPIESILPCEKVGTDLFSWSGKYYLLMIDYFSSWWEVDRLKNPTTTAVIRVLKEHFGRWRIPSTLISDNEPQFTAAQCQRFCLNGRSNVTIALLDIQTLMKRQSQMSKQPNKLRKNANEATLTPSWHCKVQEAVCHID